MATLTSSRAGSGDQARYSATGDVIETIRHSMTITASATDVLQLCKVLPGARVVGMKVHTDTSTNSYSVGTGDNTGLFMTTASTINTASVTALGVLSPIRTLDVVGSLGYSFSAADTIDLRWDAAGGKTASVIYAVIELHYDGQETV